MRNLARSLVLTIIVLVAALGTPTLATQPVSTPMSATAQTGEPEIVSFTGTAVLCLLNHVCGSYSWTTVNAVKARLVSGHIDETTGRFIKGGWFNERVPVSGTYTDFLKIGNDAARLCIFGADGTKVCAFVNLAG